MPRQARIDTPGTLHQVIVRHIKGSEIVDDDKLVEGIPYIL